MRELSHRGEEVVGTYLSHSQPGLAHLDLRDSQDARRLIDRTQPEAVWIPAALPDVDRCEREPALSHAINVEGPLVMLDLIRSSGIPLVYFSSDYVFDGRRGPYTETDPTHPLQVYGRHKVQAEKGLLTYPQTLVVRPAWVYSDEHNPRNFVFRVLSDLRQQVPVNAAVDQWNTPTPAQPLAARAFDALRHGVRGILHVVGPERMSRFDLVTQIAGLAGFPTTRITPVKLSDLNLAARRPANGGLVTIHQQWAIEERLADLDFRRLLTGP